MLCVVRDDCCVLSGTTVVCCQGRLLCVVRVLSGTTATFAKDSCYHLSGTTALLLPETTTGHRPMAHTPPLPPPPPPPFLRSSFRLLARRVPGSLRSRGGEIHFQTIEMADEIRGIFKTTSRRRKRPTTNTAAAAEATAAGTATAKPRRRRHWGH
jgi:hypothetical protein